MTPAHPVPPAKSEGSARVGLAVGGLIVIVGGLMLGVALLLTRGLREGANAAALAFANEAAAGRAPRDVPAHAGALAALRGGEGFETTTTSTNGQLSNGAACVTVSRAGAAEVRAVVVVTSGVGEVVSYGLADSCPCPARLRPTSRLTCRP